MRMSTEEKVVECSSSSEKEGAGPSLGTTTDSPPTPSQHDLDLLAKLEEANRQLQITPPPTPLPKTPLELELLEKLETANRATSDLLESTQVSKLLLLQDQDRVGEFKNKCIDDIQLEDVVFDEKVVLDHSPTSGITVTDLMESDTGLTSPNLVMEALDEADAFFPDSDEQSDQKFRKRPSQPVKKIYWSKEEEEEEINKLFKSFFDTKTWPKPSHCVKAIRINDKLQEGNIVEFVYERAENMKEKGDAVSEEVFLHNYSFVESNMEHLLLKKKASIERLLEADKKSCKGLTPTHSRSGSTAGPVFPSPNLGHSRKGSSTSNISVNSSGHINEEETGNPGSNIWEIWGKLVNDWASAKKKPAFIKQLVRKGIPNPFRCLAWQLILDVNRSPMKDMYVEYLKQKSPSEKMIRRDIARTFPEHDFFKEKDGVGQESLFHVMKAYSLHDREVGYCQGSGFIVGLLLMQMPEEEAFAVLVKLMQDYRLRELFKPSMAELGLCMYKLECLIQELLPDLYTHFQTQSFHTSMYASSWFLTLFATVVPLSVACRVMDLFVSEGMDVIFRIGIAILQSSHVELLSMDMEGMLQFFQKEIAAKFEKDEESLFNAAYQVRISAKKFKRLEKEYTALKTKENEDQVELRRLRTENRLLRQRIDNLEKESASLADRLIQYQLTRAQEAEETYALKNELSLTKQKYLDSKKQLEQAENLLGDIKERTDSINSASTLDDSEAQLAVQSLQEELITVRLKEAENCATIKTLHHKIEDLEQTNARLQKAPSNDVQCLQEELIAVKLREAEANLSLKEMRQTIADLDANWQRHLSDSDSQSSPKDKSSKGELKSELKRTQEELMSVKLKEAAALSHLKDTKQRVMELETSNQICTNQIRRMDEENKKLKGEIEEAAKQDSEAQRQIKALLRKLDDLETKRKEEMMMSRIREAENDQIIGELKQKIAAMEIQKEEVLAADRLDSKVGKQDLENTIFDLQEEVLQLRLSGNSKSSSSTSTRSFSKMDDDDDDDDIEDPESLNRTLSEIIEGKRSSTSLIAILNRENSDCDSIKSSSSENSASGLKTGHRPLKSEVSDGEKSSGANRETESESYQGRRLTASSSNDCVDVSAIEQSKGEKTVDSPQINVTGSQSNDYVKSGNTSLPVNQSGSVGSDISRSLIKEHSAMENSNSKVSCNGEVIDSNENISAGDAKYRQMKTKTDVESL